MLSQIQSYLPKHVQPFLNWETKKPVHFHLANNRKSKWGYFKAGIHNKPHVVSLNADLNPHAFLFTLVHEMAHVLCWEQFGRSVRPHGEEWKEIFRHQLFELFKQDVFPPDLIKPIWNTITKPRASCNANPDLIKAFAKYDESTELVFIDTIATNQVFEATNGKQFIKGEKLRTRFKCKELSTNRWYVFSSTAQVKPL